MWEKDLLAQAQALRKEAGDENPSPHLQQWLRQQTHKARLIAFLGRHDPLKLMQVGCSCCTCCAAAAVVVACVAYCENQFAFPSMMIPQARCDGDIDSIQTAPNIR